MKNYIHLQLQQGELTLNNKETELICSTLSDHLAILEHFILKQQGRLLWFTRDDCICRSMENFELHVANCESLIQDAKNKAKSIKILKDKFNGVMH